MEKLTLRRTPFFMRFAWSCNLSVVFPSLESRSVRWDSSEYRASCCFLIAFGEQFHKLGETFETSGADCLRSWSTRGRLKVRSRRTSSVSKYFTGSKDSTEIINALNPRTFFFAVHENSVRIMGLICNPKKVQLRLKSVNFLIYKLQQLIAILPLTPATASFAGIGHLE